MRADAERALPVSFNRSPYILVVDAKFKHG